MTNELKCPVCGEGMKLGEPETELHPALFSCENEECPINEYFYEKDIQYINEAIQSRIDKAVQEERERCSVIAKDIYESSLLTEWQKIALSKIITGAAR